MSSVRHTYTRTTSKKTDEYRCTHDTDSNNRSTTTIMPARENNGLGSVVLRGI